MISVNGVTKHYALGTQTVEALRGVSFDIKKGEFIAIMGPSGSGKSTLMNIIGCLDIPTHGTYLLNNQEVSSLDDDALAGIRNKEIGFVFQNFHLLARNSALDNIMLPLKYAGIEKADQITRAKAALSEVGLQDRMDHQPSELSGGQQQRVAIARALVNNPSILFADEPTGNLDSQTGHDVMQLFHNLHDQGQTIILITHENEVAAEAQRTIFIKDGLIESDITKEKK
ncbi:ABC transporter ATP-binding protein [Gammaproteobacteria bacterium]|nr:ABC transporter ATP-binding protein [Gammaproteobacteria bacterium]MDA9834805.1 ABC transporter ATP-binding protein [Gammaproteobacteria bacterium]MDA9868644.1 ABC transporter ATP-binding protein [Gammaproteobacteria bacterium]MDC3372285.1 ABC transporter ATP-binding protein [Gammaproteobacteria bacterium]MDC3398431.1 ABC transporter ATP-binding protein [Gammaproteobacteria bacterium]